MSDVYNAILIGFPWNQDLALAEGMIDAGDALRAEIRYTPADQEPIFVIASAGDGIAIDGLNIALTIDGSRSGSIDPPPKGKEYRTVLMDLVKIRPGGEEEHLGFRLHIPVTVSVTKAAA